MSNVIYFVHLWFYDEAFTGISIFSTRHMQLTTVILFFAYCMDKIVLDAELFSLILSLLVE